ncbi:LapA family protein [Actinotalea sp. AC32]|nr:LapA family protein [Actinotalea sp. AC32]
MPTQPEATRHQPAAAGTTRHAETSATRRGPSPSATRTGRQGRNRTRAGAAWVGICVAALLLVALIVFMLQNTGPVEVTFLGMTGTAPLGLTLLIAGVGVGLVALVIGTTRITQLRHRLGAGRTPR